VTTTPIAATVRCTDADNDTLTYTQATSPSHGSLTLNADGAYRYQAAVGYTGPDAFTYTVSDGHGGSGGATVHITVVAKPDRTAPSCAFAASGRNAAGKQQVDATLRDTGSGIASIRVVSAVNATVAMPAFAVGTTQKVVVRTTEIDSARPNNVTLEATDVAGNVVNCDPILTTLTRPAVLSLRARPYTRTFVGVPQAESRLRLRNGRPGLTRVDVIVNGRLFRLGGLHPAQHRFVDLARAMRPGRRNTIVLRPYGLPRTTATILIADR
jgi:VCBS repeat-containing protein